MFRVIREYRLALTIGLTLIASGAVDSAARAAGLVGYRNDTSKILVVQSVVTMNGATRRSRPQMLYPGEVAVDGIVLQGQRKIIIGDPKKPNVVLFQGDVNCVGDVFFSIRVKVATVPIKGQPAKEPELELVKTRPPALRNHPNGDQSKPKKP